jgi:Zn-dependent alcohol dehydrogenase
MKTRTAMVRGAGRPLEPTEVNPGGPMAGEVTVETKATGGCHSAGFGR